VHRDPGAHAARGVAGWDAGSLAALAIAVVLLAPHIVFVVVGRKVVCAHHTLGSVHPATGPLILAALAGGIGLAVAQARGRVLVLAAVWPHA